VADRISLTDDERATLERWARSRTTPIRLVLRAKIVLWASDGRTNQWIAAELRVDRQTVARWRKRFAERGLRAIQRDAPRGKRRSAEDATVRRIIEKTTRERPAGRACWTTRTLAAELGTSRSTVHRVWRDFGIQPCAIPTPPAPRFAVRGEGAVSGPAGGGLGADQTMASA
jgi:transposase